MGRKQDLDEQYVDNLLDGWAHQKELGRYDRGIQPHVWLPRDYCRMCGAGAETMILEEHKDPQGKIRPGDTYFLCDKHWLEIKKDQYYGMLHR